MFSLFPPAQAGDLLEASKSAGFVGVLLATILIFQAAVVVALWRWFKPLAEKWLLAQVACTTDVSVAIQALRKSHDEADELRQRDSLAHRQVADAYGALSSLVAMLSQRLGMHEDSVLLVVEDSLIDARVVLLRLRDAAKRYGLDILHVMTLAEARLHAWESRLIVLDVGLPDVSDPEYTLAQFVRRCRCPVIIHTGQEGFVCPGAEAVIEKGNLNQLIGKVEEVLARERRQHGEPEL